MEISNHYKYDFEDSFGRIDEILNTNATFEERDEIPSRDELTYNNGFYVKCNALFIDIRDSSDLPNQYKRPTLAKIYRSYISELVAVLSEHDTCKEINIVGDCVAGIFEASSTEDTLGAFSASYTVASLVDTLNYKLCRKGINPIKIGIGLAKGRALMIQAGYKGSGIKDVVWMGDVVNTASNLCSEGSKGTTGAICLSQEVFEDLEGKVNKYGIKYQDMFYYDKTKEFYHAFLHRIDMYEWLKEQQQANPCSI